MADRRSPIFDLESITRRPSAPLAPSRVWGCASTAMPISSSPELGQGSFSTPPTSRRAATTAARPPPARWRWWAAAIPRPGRSGAPSKPGLPTWRTGPPPSRRWWACACPASTGVTCWDKPESTGKRKSSGWRAAAFVASSSSLRHDAFAWRGGPVPLHREVVDGAHDHDDRQGSLENRDIAQRPGDWVWQGTEGRVAQGTRPEEVDDHGPAPDQRQHVDDGAPAAQLEGGFGLGPPLETGAQDCEVAEQVRGIDHPGGGDGDDPGAGVVEERESRQGAHDQAGADRCVQGGADLVVDPAEWQLPVTGHAEGEPDSRGLDGQAAHVDRRKDDEQVQVGGPARQVAGDNADRRSDRATGGIRDVLVNVAGDGDDRRVHEHPADDERPDDRGQHGPGGSPPGVISLFGQGARRIEAVDNEQGHEHGGQEGARLVAKARAKLLRIEHHARRLVVVEDQ